MYGGRAEAEANLRRAVVIHHQCVSLQSIGMKRISSIDEGLPKSSSRPRL
jgi:hypothetical protein